MELWMIRHGLPVRIDGGSGPADPSLAPEGADQARRLAAHWGRHPLDAVWSSPQRRAFETAVPLAEATGNGIEADDRLREFDAHLDFYVPLEELREDEAAWKRMVAEWRSPEAEAQRRTFRERVVGAVEEIAAAHPEGRRRRVPRRGHQRLPLARGRPRPDDLLRAGLHEREPRRRRGPAGPARQRQRDAAPGRARAAPRL
ncbi:MAG: histidine phosphatase family protein [Acidimicrobiales bacterium]